MTARALTLGTLVRFYSERNGGPVHRVVSVMSDGMIEIHDMGGYFAPHLFEVADDVGGIPPSVPRELVSVACCDPLKRSAVFSFEGGSLEVKLSGFDAENGNACFIFDEDDVQWHAHDERSGCYLEVKIPHQEITEMRDWLIKFLNAEILP